MAPSTEHPPEISTEYESYTYWAKRLAAAKNGEFSVTTKAGLTAKAVVALAKALSDNHTVTWLKLYNNGLDAIKAKVLFVAIKDHRSLKKFSIYNQNIGDGGWGTRPRTSSTSKSRTPI
jgi:hypothetical protein